MRAQKVTTVDGRDILVLAGDDDQLIEGAPLLEPTEIVSYVDTWSEPIEGDGTGEALPEVLPNQLDG